MNATRADEADRENGRRIDLALHVEIPLHLIGCNRSVVVHRIALRWLQSGWERRRRESGEHQNRKAIGRIEIVARCVGTRRDGVVEDSEPAANRRLVVIEGIVCKTEPWIEVREGRVGLEDVRHKLKTGRFPVVRNRVKKSWKLQDW